MVFWRTSLMMRGDEFDLFLSDTVVASGNVTVVGAASVGLGDVA